MNIFEQASRMKLRFHTAKGLASVEDLWDIPLTSQHKFDLDTCAKLITKQIKLNDEESFVKPKSTTACKEELGLEILKHVIKAKLDAANAKTLEAAKAAKKAKILEILAAKEDEGLKGKSEEDLKKMLEEL